MGNTLLKLFHWLHLLIFILQLIFSVKLIKNDNALPIMRKFFWYPIVGIIVTFFIVTQHYNIISIRLVFCINLFSLLFHYLFLSYLIFNVTGKRKHFKMIIWLFFLVIPLLIINDILNKRTDSVAYTNGCLFFYSLFYFYSLYNGETRVQLLNNPIFYICCGVLIGTGLIVPAALMIKYLFLLKQKLDLLSLVVSVSMIGYIIMNLFFIKAMLCSKVT